MNPMTTTTMTERTIPAHAALPQFAIEGELVVGGERLSLLAERVGQTPFYAYDRGHLRQRVSPSCAPRCRRASSCTTR
jgi:diaminopimelate decarboxylase